MRSHCIALQIKEQERNDYDYKEDKAMTLRQKLQTKMTELMTERENTTDKDKYWLDLEIEDLEVKIAKIAKLESNV